MIAAILLCWEAENVSLVILSKLGHRGNDKKCQTMNHTDTIGCHPVTDVMPSKEENMCLLDFWPGSGQRTMGDAKQRQGYNRLRGALTHFQELPINTLLYYITNGIWFTENTLELFF